MFSPFADNSEYQYTDSSDTGLTHWRHDRCWALSELASGRARRGAGCRGAGTYFGDDPI